MKTKCPNCDGEGSYKDHCGFTCICSMCAGSGTINEKQIRLFLQLEVLAKNAKYDGPLY